MDKIVSSCLCGAFSHQLLEPKKAGSVDNQSLLKELCHDLVKELEKKDQVFEKRDQELVKQDHDLQKQCLEFLKRDLLFPKQDQVFEKRGLFFLKEDINF
jgi:hypothetical protein